MEGTGASREEEKTCAKALSHFFCFTSSDSHSKSLSSSFQIWLFGLLWGIHFAIFNGYTNKDVNDNNHVIKKSSGFTSLIHPCLLAGQTVSTQYNSKYTVKVQ